MTGEFGEFAEKTESGEEHRVTQQFKETERR